MYNHAKETYSRFGGFDLSAHEDPESSSTNVINHIGYTTKVNITNNATIKKGTIRKVPEDTVKKLNAEGIKLANPAFYNALNNPGINGTSLGACIRTSGLLVTKYSDVIVMEGFSGQANPAEFLEVKLKYIL